MKKIIYIISLFLTIACNSEKAGDCFQTGGDIIQIEIDVPNFQKITVHQRVELFIEQGDEQKIIIESGENLLPDITVEVIDNELIIKNYNTCNFFREYDLTKVYVTSPNITTIRNASEQNVSSIGTLTYPSLYLRSTGEESDFLPIGDWHLNIKNENVTIWSNGIAIFYLEGSTTNLNVGFSDGNTRFEGKNFNSKNVTVRNVSSNDVIINPIQSLKGSIHSTGNIISYHKPPIVEVEVLNDYGELIFK